MDADAYWQRFVFSGKIEDYMAYAALHRAQKKDGGTDDAPDDRGTCDQGKKSR